MYCGIDKSVLKKFQSTANLMDNQEKRHLNLSTKFLFEQWNNIVKKSEEALWSAGFSYSDMKHFL